MVQAYAAMEADRELAAVVLALATSFVATAMAVMVVCCSQSQLVFLFHDLPLPRLKFADSFFAKNARVAAQTRRAATFLKPSRALTTEPSGLSARLISLALGPSLCPTTSNI